MPQASDEQRKQWGGQQGVGEDKAENFLREQGWILQRNWTWWRPDWREPTPEEKEAAGFLCDEWDYGWFESNIGLF